MLSRLLVTTLLVAAPIAATVTAPALAQSSAEEARFRAAQERFDREYDVYRQAVERYRNARSGGGYAQPYDNGDYRRAPDRYDDNRDDDSRYDGDARYDPARDYRDGSQYRERVLSNEDRVYAGYDGRYYCKRSDGTTGLIVGAAGGGLLGNVIDGGRSRTVGTLLGAAAGALAGRAVEQNQQQVRCR